MSRRLLIDVGNTRIKWALVDPRQRLPQWHPQRGIDTGWLACGAVTHGDFATLESSWQRLGLTSELSDAVISHVAGPALRDRLLQLLGRIGLASTALHLFASVACAAGVRNGYRDPSSLGCDRFAALIGARSLFPQQRLLVVTCGTATTIDALDDNGDFLGGMILPGMALMSNALARNTAQLPQIGAMPALPPMFADHTEAAIASGCLNAQAGAIERAFRAHPGAICVVSGGAAGVIVPTLSVPHHLVDNLVLPGLQAAFTSLPPC